MGLTWKGCRKACARQEPEEIHARYAQRHASMTAPAAREPLIGVRTVSILNTLAPHQAARERYGRIDEKNAGQYQPYPKRSRIFTLSAECEDGNDVAEVAAAHVTHEDLGGRPIPEQEAEASRTEYEPNLRNTAGTAMQESHRAARAADEHRL